MVGEKAEKPDTTKKPAGKKAGGDAAAAGIPAIVTIRLKSPRRVSLIAAEILYWLKQLTGTHQSVMYSRKALYKRKHSAA